MEVCNFKKLRQGFRKEEGFISFLFGWALVTIIFLVILLFQFLRFSTPSEIKELKGQGTVRTYNSSYDEVFQAAIDLINEKGLTIIEINKKEGYIIIDTEPDFYYKGRIMALFFTLGSSENHT